MTPVGGSDESVETIRDRAKRLGAEGRYSDAVANWDRLIEEGDEIDTAEALAWKSWCLVRLGDAQRFLAVVDELENRYADSPDPWLRGTAAYGLRLKTWWLLRSGRVSDAVAAIEELGVRFKAETDGTAQSRLGEGLLEAARYLAWYRRSRGERLIEITLLAQPALDRVASAWREMPATAPVLDAVTRRLAASVERPCVATRENRRTAMEQSVAISDLLIGGVDTAGDSPLGKLAIRAQINRAVLLVVLGRWRAAKSAFDALFALKPGELAEVIKVARATPGGEYGPTDVAIAILAGVSGDDDDHDRSSARALLQQQSKRAGSAFDRLLARTALRTGKRH
jgi:tetratricopeptide (TPR) repeat protein